MAGIPIGELFLIFGRKIGQKKQKKQKIEFKGVDGVVSILYQNDVNER
jgi:hypothetical protein